jgi:hypothetical protein
MGDRARRCGGEDGTTGGAPVSVYTGPERRAKLHPSLPMVAAILAFPESLAYEDDARGDKRFRRDALAWLAAIRPRAMRAAKEATR